MRYKHIVITRFNIQISRTPEARPTAEWMTERLRLFGTYCLPCMAAQSERSFTWLLLVDQHTEEAHLSALREMCAPYPFIRIRQTAETNNLTALYKQIAEEEKGDCDYLVSTRLDNDDCVSSEFVSEIQKALKPTDEPYVISFPTGCQLFEKQHVMFELYYPNNHFVTLVEGCGREVRTVLDVDHRELTQLPTAYVREGEIMWGELVHGGNVLNGFTPHTKTTVTDVQELPFAVDFGSYLDYGRNKRAKAEMYVRYRLRSVGNLLRRLAGRN